MNNIKNISITTALFTSLAIVSSSCIDEYWPELGNKYDRTMVVEGTITNEPGPYTVRLSLSTPVNNPYLIPVNFYTVVISDNLGNEEVLTLIGPGEYTTSPNGIQGVVGRSYKISIYGNEGEAYESAYEELLEPAEIKSVYGKLEFHQDANYEYDLAGYQFYLDSYKALSDTGYFMWRMKGTYKFHSNHSIKYVFDHGQMRQMGQWDTLFTCWKTYDINEIFTFNTIGLSEPVISGIPLNYVTTEYKELSIRYCLNVRQMTISSRAFDYWDGIREQNEQQGSLFTRQPYQIRGNVVNINNPEEPVLGYFLVAGVDDQAVFVDRPPPQYKFRYNTECFLVTSDLYWILMSMRKQWPVYLTGTYVGAGQSPALPANQICVDCTADGGVLDRPEFWID